MEEFVTRNVVLGKQDETVVEDRVKREGLGPRGFSIALRMIIRDWNRMRQQSKDDCTQQEVNGSS